MPRRFLPLLLFVFPVFVSSVLAQAPQEKEVTTVVQRLFDAMKAKDAAAVRTVFIPSAPVISIRAGKVAASNSEDFATRLTASADSWVERMWNPVVKVQGNIAFLWAPYDFHRGGKLDHCGIDSISLSKTEGTWKIATLTFTSETEGCGGSPLGPLQ